MLVIRAAFDLGSSQHKLTVAAVDPCMPSSLTILHSAAIRVPLADSLTSTTQLPTSILSHSTNAVRTLHRVAISHGATSFCAIATQVFRVATNGSSHLSMLSHKFSFPISILSASDEGQLAFATVLQHESVRLQNMSHALAPCASVVNDSANLVVWDSGGGSSQWAHVPGAHASGVAVHTLPLGSGVVRAAFGKVGSMSRRASALGVWIRERVTRLTDEELSEKCREGMVLAIGSSTSMFAIGGRLWGETFTLRQVEIGVDQVIEDWENGRLEGLDVYRDLPKLVLLRELMKGYEIHVVRWVPANGSCVGLLTCNDERFWPMMKDRDVVLARPADRVVVDGVQWTSC